MRLYRFAAAYSIHLFVALLSTSLILADQFSSLLPILGVSCAAAGGFIQEDGIDCQRKQSKPSCTKTSSCYRQLQSPRDKKAYYFSLKSDLPYSPVITASPTAKRVRFIEPLTDTKGNNDTSEKASEESRQGEKSPRAIASPVAQVSQPSGALSQTFSPGSEEEEFNPATESRDVSPPSVRCSTGSSPQTSCQKKPIGSPPHEEKPESCDDDSKHLEHVGGSVPARSSSRLSHEALGCLTEGNRRKNQAEPSSVRLGLKTATPQPLLPVPGSGHVRMTVPSTAGTSTASPGGVAWTSSALPSNRPSSGSLFMVSD